MCRCISACVCVYMYVHVCMYACMYVSAYIYMERARERELCVDNYAWGRVILLPESEVPTGTSLNDVLARQLVPGEVRV